MLGDGHHPLGLVVGSLAIGLPLGGQIGGMQVEGLGLVLKSDAGQRRRIGVDEAVIPDDEHGIRQLIEERVDFRHGSIQFH